MYFYAGGFAGINAGCYIGIVSDGGLLPILFVPVIFIIALEIGSQVAGLGSLCAKNDFKAELERRRNTG